MNGTKTITTGLLLAALSVAGNAMAQVPGAAGMGMGDPGSGAATLGAVFEQTIVQENPVPPEGPTGSTTTMIVGPDGTIHRTITLSPEDSPGPGAVYSPETGQTVFIPGIVPPTLQVPGPDTSEGTISRPIPELPLEIKRATLGEFLQSPRFSDLDIDLEAIPPAILNAEIDELLLNPSMVAMVQSMITDERLEMLFDSLVNDPGPIVSDMLENIQMPTGTGTGT